MMPNESQSPSIYSRVPVASSHQRICAAAVRHLCGGISDMTLHRWQKDEALAFPTPIKLGQRRYWRQSDVEAWLEARQIEAEGVSQ